MLQPDRQPVKSDPADRELANPRFVKIMAAFVIANVTVNDPVRYEDYSRLVPPTLAKYRRPLHRARRTGSRCWKGTGGRTGWCSRVPVDRAGARVVEFARVRRSRAFARRTSTGTLHRSSKGCSDWILSSTSWSRYWGYSAFRPLQREAMQRDPRRPRLGRRACRPAAASRSASRRRRWCGRGSRSSSRR